MASNQQITLALRIRADLADAQNALKQMTGDLDQVDHRVTQATSSLDGMGGQLSSLRGQVLGFVGAWAGLNGLSSLVSLADEYGQMADRIQMATNSTAEYQEVQSRLLDTANLTFRPLTEAQELFIGTADSLRALKYDTSQALDITDSFSYLLVTNAASADRAASAIGGLSKSIQTNKVDSDSWQSLLAAMPTVVNALADTTGKTTGEIRKLGIEGKLSLSDLLEAFRLTMDSNRKAAEGMSTTVRDAFVNLSTNLSAYLGEANRSTEVTATMASAINLVGQNIDTVARLLGVVAVAAITRYLASLTLSTAGRLADILATRAQVAEEVRLASAQAASTATAAANARAQAGLTLSHTQAAAAEAAHTAATQRLAAAQLAAGSASRAMLGLMGGPAGIAVLAASAAASLFLFCNGAEQVRSSLSDLNEPLDQVIERMGKLSAIERSNELTRLSTQIDGVRAQAATIANQIGAEASRALYGTRHNKVPTEEARAIFEPILEASRQAAQGAQVDWAKVFEGLDKSNAVADLKRELVDLAVKQSESSRTASDMKSRHDELAKSIDTSTGALSRNNGELTQGSQAAADYIQKLRLAIADINDPSVLGKAGRRLGELGKDVTPEQSAEILRLETEREQAEKAAKARDEAQRKNESQAKQQSSTAAQLTKSQESYVESLEKQASTLGLTSAQVRAYELAEKGLTGALKARAEAALATVAADEKKRQAEANARTNAGLETEYLRAAGRDVEAGLLEIRAKFGAMRQEFEKSGNEAGLAWIDKLVPVAEAKVRLDDVKQQLDDLLAEQQRAESSVGVQQDTGVINEMEARQRILDIHRATFEKLQQIRPILEQMARQPGEVGQAAAQALAALDSEAQRLQATTTQLQTVLRDGLTTGFTEALKGLANGTMDLRDAITSLAQSVADALLNMAAQNLAQSLASGVMGLFGGGDQGAGLTTGALAVSGSAAQLSIAGGTLLTGAAAIEAAAISLAAANASSGVGGGSSSGAKGGGSWFSLAASAAASYFGGSSVKAATGGHILGPGTDTSDSIRADLSNWEYVTRAAVVRQPGALPFLHDFNTYGMAALHKWASRIGHATGGLAGTPAPTLPPPVGAGVSPPDTRAQMSATLKNSQNFYLVDDPGRIQDVAFNDAGIEKLLVRISRDPARFRSVFKAES